MKLKLKRPCAVINPWTLPMASRQRIGRRRRRAIRWLLAALRMSKDCWFVLLFMREVLSLIKSLSS